MLNNSEFRVTEFATSQGELIVSKQRSGILFSTKTNKLCCDYLGISISYDIENDDPRKIATEELAFIWEVYVVGPYSGTTRRAQELKIKMLNLFVQIDPNNLTTKIENMDEDDKESLLQSLEIYMNDIQTVQQKLEALMDNWKRVMKIIEER